MRLVVYELKTSVTQEITIGDYPIQVEAIRPHMYKHLNPAGSVKMQIADVSDVVLSETAEMTIQSFHDYTGDYFHGVVNFDIKVPLQANTSYKIKMLGTNGYVFNESAYVGWCNGFDLRVVPEIYLVESDMQAALLVELWSRKKVNKGLY